MNAPQRLTHDEANDFATAWTPDSKAVLLYSNRNGTPGIFKQGQPGCNRASGYRAAKRNPSAPQRRWRLDTLLGAFKDRRPIHSGSPHAHSRRRWSPSACAANAGGSGLSVRSRPVSLRAVFETSVDGKQLTLTAFDPLKGRGEVLRITQIDPANAFGETSSPDGATIALSIKREAEIHIHLLSLSGEPDREFTVKGWSNLTGLNWSPDGKGLYCGSASPQSRTLLYVDLKGNAHVLWQHKGTGGGHLGCT